MESFMKACLLTFFIPCRSYRQRTPTCMCWFFSFSFFAGGIFVLFIILFKVVNKDFKGKVKSLSFQKLNFENWAKRSPMRQRLSSSCRYFNTVAHHWLVTDGSYSDVANFNLVHDRTHWILVNKEMFRFSKFVLTGINMNIAFNWWYDGRMN